ncbi:MAG: hypothetical protein LKCHEGNO_01624 [Burkholderiaceae bacterium]|nr:hypothetical protein [Burkholderiaceae bacterium]
MAAMSRTKGKVGEREIGALIRDLTGWEVRRRVRQHEGDADLEGIPGWCAESKRHARAGRADIAKWWAQAVDQAARVDQLPVLFFRIDRDAWRAVWPVALVLGAERSTGWLQYDLTAETSIAGWAAVARELVAHDAERPKPHEHLSTPQAPETMERQT